MREPSLPSRKPVSDGVYASDRGKGFLEVETGAPRWPMTPLGDAPKTVVTRLVPSNPRIYRALFRARATRGKTGTVWWS
jgi:hypothetical protein